MSRNFGEIKDVLLNEFHAIQPYPNPYIFQINYPRGMGLKRLVRYLDPAAGIELSEDKPDYIYVNVDEFLAVVVDNSTPLSNYFNVKPFEPHSCIKVRSLPGEFSEEQVHAVQNVINKLYKPGDQVRVRILYSNGTDYGSRRLVK